MPKLWNATVDAHRREVRDAILASTWDLVRENGLTSVTMSQVAERAGIGRATLYKYFPDLDAILVAWHERHVGAHMAGLVELAAGIPDPRARLAAVLTTYAQNIHRRQVHGGQLVAMLHRREHVDRAQQQLQDMVRDLLVEVASTGSMRLAPSAEVLAAYCVHAVTAAADLATEDEVGELVAVVLDGLRSG